MTTPLDSASPIVAFDPALLQPGDILLMLGTAPLSELIAWAGDSIYSHASLVTHDAELVEASLSGVRRQALSKRMGDRANFHYIDAYRPLSHDGKAISADDIACVLTRADHYIGAPYPTDQLALLGIIFAVRGKLPSDPAGRLLTRMALERLVGDDGSRIVCTELVYRAFHECMVEPAGRLAPRIVLQPRGTAPFPDLDWKALYEEVGPLLAPKTSDKSLQAEQTIGDDELIALAAAVRERLGGDGSGMALRGTQSTEQAGPELPNPNPKLISPLDLATTPSHVYLGRVMAADPDPQPA